MPFDSFYPSTTLNSSNILEMTRSVIYATRVMVFGEYHFFETLEHAYVEELYATTMVVLGDIDEARK